VPRIEVYNKSDLLSPDEQRRLIEADPSGVLISAVAGDGCPDLLDIVAARLSLDQQRVSLEFDLSKETDRERLAWLYRHGHVHGQVMMGDRALIDAEVPRRLLDRVRPAPAPRQAGARRG
jgi:50S ribosomal subunit-associated GTPase HflX